MAERPTSVTRSREAREERPLARREPLSIFGTNPFAQLQRFADEMDRIFEDFGLGRRGFRAARLMPETSAELWAPDIDVFQRDNQLTIRADLPGIKKEQLQVDVTDDAVTIHGERRREHEVEEEGLYRSECSYGSFSRVIPLPKGAMTDQAKASFRDGVLEISMPAPPASRGRRLEIAEEGKR